MIGMLFVAIPFIVVIVLLFKVRQKAARKRAAALRLESMVDRLNSPEWSTVIYNYPVSHRETKPRKVRSPINRVSAPIVDYETGPDWVVPYTPSYEPSPSYASPSSDSSSSDSGSSDSGSDSGVGGDFGGGGASDSF